MSGCELHNDVQRQLREHERRIAAVEKSNGEILIRIDNLCGELKELGQELKGLVASIRRFSLVVITALGGFFIWYVQSLPR